MSSSRQQLETLTVQREAKTVQTSAERQEMRRKRLSKSGQHTVKWNVIARGSDGWGTPCPGKRGITSQFTVFGQSQKRARNGKLATQQMTRYFIESIFKS